MCRAFEIFLDKLAIGGVETLVGAVLVERDIGRVIDRPMSLSHAQLTRLPIDRPPDSKTSNPCLDNELAPVQVP